MQAFTTGRAAGSFGLQSVEPANEVMGRWHALVDGARAEGVARFATASQVHGAELVIHEPTWSGWLRRDAADGHVWGVAGTGAAVTIADCVPVFIGHPSGAGAILHSGWRGTAAGITERAIAWFVRSGFGAASLRMHLGPAICGSCYEVSADVAQQVTGSTARGPVQIDLRAAIADRANRLGVRDIAISEWCTRCSNDRLFSHRAGDAGRQLGVLLSPHRLR
jgi:polyphenol oxidase